MPACALLAGIVASCGNEPLPPVRPAHPQPRLVEGWQVPDADGLREQLVRAYVAEDSLVPSNQSATRAEFAYCVFLCAYDIAKQRCQAYDPPESFFERFRGTNLPVFPSYACPFKRPRLTMWLLVGPFWQWPGEQGLVAEVGMAPPFTLPEAGAEYAATWAAGGWKVQFRSPPPP
jgi:hypothetical protein